MLTSATNYFIVCENEYRAPVTSNAFFGFTAFSQDEQETIKKEMYSRRHLMDANYIYTISDLHSFRRRAEQKSVKAKLSEFDARLSKLEGRPVYESIETKSKPCLSSKFAEFMQEDIERRAYIYRYAHCGARIRRHLFGSPAYFTMHADKYEDDVFLQLLAKIPQECII